MDFIGRKQYFLISYFQGQYFIRWLDFLRAIVSSIRINEQWMNVIMVLVLHHPASLDLRTYQIMNYATEF